MKLGQIVSFSYQGGYWKIVRIHKQDKIFANCQRFDIQHTESGEVINQVRDKDIHAKGSQFFEQFAAL
jgi:hypothetical protein